MDGNFSIIFSELIAFFLQKLNLPSERWDDIREAAHDRAFIVAGAMKADLVNDLREAVSDAITQGLTLRTFRRRFAEIVAKHGWTGWTGEGTAAGEAWRTRIIYQTNMRTSYAAGRWAQLHDPDLLRVRPYFRYVHNDNVLHPRPLHLQWGDSGLTLHYTHPFWRTHYPPNGWGCWCYVISVARPRPGDATEPPPGWDTIDPRTGAPPGIDRGWGYAPGAHLRTDFAELIEQKLITLDGPVGAAMMSELGPILQAAGITL